MKIFKAIAMALSALVILVGVYATFTKKDQPTSDTGIENKNMCSDLNRSIIVFREGCEASTALGFGSGDWDNKKKWCDCVEKNYTVQEFVDSECSIPKLNVYMNIWNDDRIRVTCGSPKDPR